MAGATTKPRTSRPGLSGDLTAGAMSGPRNRLRPSATEARVVGAGYCLHGTQAAAGISEVRSRLCGRSIAPPRQASCKNFERRSRRRNCVAGPINLLPFLRGSIRSGMQLCVRSAPGTCQSAAPTATLAGKLVVPAYAFARLDQSSCPLRRETEIPSNLAHGRQTTRLQAHHSAALRLGFPTGSRSLGRRVMTGEQSHDRA